LDIVSVNQQYFFVLAQLEQVQALEKCKSKKEEFLNADVDEDVRGRAKEIEGYGPEMPVCEISRRDMSADIFLAFAPLGHKAYSMALIVPHFTYEPQFMLPTRYSSLELSAPDFDPQY
jgi:hypothetical protein